MRQYQPFINFVTSALRCRNSRTMIEHSSAAPRLADDRRWMRLSSLGSISIIVSILGAILLATGLWMPAYTDSVAAERIRSGSECERGVRNENENLQCNNEQWHRSMDSLRTDKWQFVDLGSGLMASALSILAFAKWKGRKSWSEMATPRRKLSFLILVSVCWLMQIPGYDVFYLMELTRGYHPWWADSIGIPIYETRRLVTNLFLPYLGIWLCFVVGARLPARAFSMVANRPVVNFFWTVSSVLLAAPVGLCLMDAIFEGPTLMVPFLWLTLWLTLCARAAALTRHRPKGARLQTR
jgi:hypothetical protein